MENALLIGLSRQIALQRELDVVANNIANLNTTGYKADGAIFQEFLMPVAQRRRLPGRRPASELRAGPRHLARFRLPARSSRPATRSTSPSTATPSSWCRRRAASATRATARSRSTPRASSSPARGDRVLGDGGPIQFQITDNNISINPDGTITVREGSNSRIRFGARQAAARALRQRPAAAEGRHEPVRRARRRRAAAGADERARRCKARSSNRTCARCVEMARMIEVTRTYTQIAGLLQQHSDHAPQRHRQARRSSGLDPERQSPCARSTPQRPE